MARRLDAAQKARIVELRLQRIPVRAVAKEVGVSLASVDDVFRKWLAEESPTAGVGMRDLNNETRARFDLVAAEARKGVAEARKAANHAAVARYLAVELAALARIAAMDAVNVAPGSMTTKPAAGEHRPAPPRDEVAEVRARREARLARAHAAPPPARGPQQRRRRGS